MGKLHEVIAAEDTRATAFKGEVTAALSVFKQEHPFTGAIQEIRATVEDESGGMHVPEGIERLEVEETVTDRLRGLVRSFGQFVEVVADKEIGNTVARANVFDPAGDEIASDLPATFLLSMENKLKPLLAVLREIPVHDMKAEWTPVDGTEVVEGRTETKFLTKKVERTKVVIQPTEHQPGQYHTFTEDMKVGEKTMTALSGKWSPGRKALIIERVENLISCLKQARQRANEVEVPSTDVSFITDYILEGL